MPRKCVKWSNVKTKTRYHGVLTRTCKRVCRKGGKRCVKRNVLIKPNGQWKFLGGKC
jgi:hypothetical protein